MRQAHQAILFAVLLYVICCVDGAASALKGNQQSFLRAMSSSKKNTESLSGKLKEGETYKKGKCLECMWAFDLARVYFDREFGNYFRGPHAVRDDGDGGKVMTPGFSLCFYITTYFDEFGVDVDSEVDSEVTFKERVISCRDRVNRYLERVAEAKSLSDMYMNGESDAPPKQSFPILLHELALGNKITLDLINSPGIKNDNLSVKDAFDNMPLVRSSRELCEYAKMCNSEAKSEWNRELSLHYVRFKSKYMTPPPLRNPWNPMRYRSFLNFQKYGKLCPKSKTKTRETCMCFEGCFWNDDEKCEQIEGLDTPSGSDSFPDQLPTNRASESECLKHHNSPEDETENRVKLAADKLRDAPLNFNMPAKYVYLMLMDWDGTYQNRWQMGKYHASTQAEFFRFTKDVDESKRVLIYDPTPSGRNFKEMFAYGSGSLPLSESDRCVWPESYTIKSCQLDDYAKAARSRPWYVCVNVHNKSIGCAMPMSSPYGEIVFELDDTLKEKAVYWFFDSLSAGVLAPLNQRGNSGPGDASKETLSFVSETRCAETYISKNKKWWTASTSETLEYGLTALSRLRATSGPDVTGLIEDIIQETDASADNPTIEAAVFEEIVFPGSDSSSVQKKFSYSLDDCLSYSAFEGKVGGFSDDGVKVEDIDSIGECYRKAMHSAEAGCFQYNSADKSCTLHPREGCRPENVEFVESDTNDKTFGVLNGVIMEDLKGRIGGTPSGYIYEPNNAEANAVISLADVACPQSKLQVFFSKQDNTVLDLWITSHLKQLKETDDVFKGTAGHPTVQDKMKEGSVSTAQLYCHYLKGVPATADGPYNALRSGCASAPTTIRR